MKTVKLFLVVAIIGAATYARALDGAGTPAAPRNNALTNSDAENEEASKMPLDVLVGKAQNETDATRKRYYVKILARFTPKDSQTISKLAELVSESDGKKSISEAASRALQNVASDDMLLSEYVKLMEHKNARVRFAAVVVMGRNKNKKAVPGLIKRLDDGDGYVASRAGQALAEIGDESAIPELIARIGRSSGYGLAIAQFGVPGLNLILKEIEKPGKAKEEKIKMAQAIGFLHDPKTITPLKALLKNADSYVRLNAVQSLGNMKDVSVAEAAKDDDSLVRLYAVEAIRKNDSPLMVSHLIDMFANDKSPEVRIAAASALGYKKAKEAVSYLQKALDDPNQDIRVSAERALTAIIGEAKK